MDAHSLRSLKPGDGVLALTDRDLGEVKGLGAADDIPWLITPGTEASDVRPEPIVARCFTSITTNGATACVVPDSSAARLCVAKTVTRGAGFVAMVIAVRQVATAIRAAVTRWISCAAWSVASAVSIAPLTVVFRRSCRRRHADVIFDSLPIGSYDGGGWTDLLAVPVNVDPARWSGHQLSAARRERLGQRRRRVTSAKGERGLILSKGMTRRRAKRSANAASTTSNMGWSESGSAVIR